VVPKITFAKMLELALEPPEESMVLPYSEYLCVSIYSYSMFVWVSVCVNIPTVCERERVCVCVNINVSLSLSCACARVVCEGGWKDRPIALVDHTHTHTNTHTHTHTHTHTAAGQKEPTKIFTYTF
jgi:hypothetical protein